MPLLLALLFATPVTLGRAIDAWESGHFDAAARLYGETLERGGLDPRETLFCYVHLGVARAVTGDGEAALRAFRVAAQLNPRFRLPPEAGKRARELAERAQREQLRDGPLLLAFDVPESAQAGKGFHLALHVEAPAETIATTVQLSVRAPDGHTHTKSLPWSTNGFEIPGDWAPEEGVALVHADVLDQHQNRLQSLEKEVHLERVAEAFVAPAPAGKPADKEDEEGPEEAWSIPHGSKRYTAARVKNAPDIDGKLDEPIWLFAPKDDRFLSTRSKPYGAPTTEPTVVQIAYDDEYLYVAFRCAYSQKNERDESFPADETTLLTEAESVAVLVDAEHGHAGAYLFAVTPTGARADAEISSEGSVQNLDFRGIWDSAVLRAPDGSWTAELRIPWGTLRMPAHPESFDVGLELTRREPISGEYALWTLHPPATELYDTNFFGHLDGLQHVYPGQRLFLQPYIAAAYDTTALSNPSPLSDLIPAGGPLRAYGGGYARFRPPGPVQVDATINPDFSAVSPDQVTANFDRFEIEYPEARPFFAEDATRFSFGMPRYLFGDLGAQLFYSRRFGIVTDTAGNSTAVPILWGAKSVLRTGGTEAAVMNVQTVPAQGGLHFLDNDTVARFTQTFEGQRLGAIVLARGGDSGGYLSGGADGSMTLYDRHLELSGFIAGSSSAGRGSAAGEGTVSWRSQDAYVKGTYIEIGSDFDAPLGFFPVTGARGELFAAGYSPVVRNDKVQQVFLDSQLTILHDRATDALIYQRGTAGLTVQTIEQAAAQLLVQPSIEHVTAAFPIGNGRITIQPGLYRPFTAAVNITTAPSRVVVFSIGYQGGDLYAGTRRAPSVSLGLNLGRLTSKLSYQLFLLHYGSDEFTGHDFNLTATYSYTPLIKTALVVEADTVAARGTVELTTTAQYGMLSLFTFTLRGQSGSTLDTLAANFTDNPHLSAIVSFALGATPL